MNEYRSTITYTPGTRVTRPTWNDDEVYVVVYSRNYRTDVVTADGVNISFATRDLTPVN